MGCRTPKPSFTKLCDCTRLSQRMSSRQLRMICYPMELACMPVILLGIRTGVWAATRRSGARTPSSSCQNAGWCPIRRIVPVSESLSPRASTSLCRSMLDRVFVLVSSKLQMSYLFLFGHKSVVLLLCELMSLFRLQIRNLGSSGDNLCSSAAIPVSPHA